MEHPISRRSFVAAGVTAAALSAQDQPDSGWQFFQPGEIRLVAAICNQIIPADQDPGALDADVPRYIDRQLAGPLERFAPLYRSGLPAFEESCVRLTGTSFLDLAFDGQKAFLEQIDGGGVKGSEWKGQTAASFFSMVIDHTMQGFYGSPAHGGNKDEVSWKMLGVAQHMGHGPHHGGER